jgi:hydrogenase maturation protease
MTLSTLIVGLGSPYGDDQIGWVACKQLKIDIGHLPSVEFVICDRSGLEWLTKMSHAGQVLFIDAMRSGEKPGTVRKIDLNTAQRDEYPVKLSSHGINIMEAIDVAKSLGELPDRISVWGVEMAQCTYENGLSESAKTALPTLLANIKAEILQ